MGESQSGSGNSPRWSGYAAVNAVMVEAYWKIGRRIVEEEQAGSHRAEYRLVLPSEEELRDELQRRHVLDVAPNDD